jgi:hypothetical protein
MVQGKWVLFQSLRGAFSSTILGVINNTLDIFLLLTWVLSHLISQAVNYLILNCFSLVAYRGPFKRFLRVFSALIGSKLSYLILIFNSFRRTSCLSVVSVALHYGCHPNPPPTSAPDALIVPVAKGCSTMLRCTAAAD